jgi:hypothetical protein
MVLQPPIGALYFAFVLRRQIINDLDVAVIEDLFPLRVGFIGERAMVSPDGVRVLDKAKDGMAVHIEAVRQSIYDKNSFKALYVAVGSLRRDEA